MYYLTCCFLLIMVLISVGFFTLLERKVLSYMQLRKGPNKVGYMGMLQPFSDGLKLFLKEVIFPMNSNYLIYFLCPIYSIFQSLFVWCLFPYYVNCINFVFGFLFFLCCSSFSVYGLIICGWSSNSIYSILGCLRGVSQVISYEVIISLIMFIYFFMLNSYNLYDYYFFQVDIWFIFFSLPLFFCWMSCCMAESNRSPFDFSEGESELVSGFNIEYGSIGFALLFISEYASIIFISLLSCMIFLGGDINSFWFYCKVVFLCFFFIWVRATLPRYRYDKLMYLAWSLYLPVLLNYLIFLVFVKFYIL
uniref:NADH dehydrogenase subunit 1 n=1 Tax=Jogocerus viraktamathi TaxID=3111112 RepID=UPI002E7950B2|nr:NADH dehydrogenase subunit 1 [Jogocerus viraktamathi]WRK19238.1 NADH dehydrogenase subunit 1 [Jogocerus viraktamathi]